MACFSDRFESRHASTPSATAVVIRIRASISEGLLAALLESLFEYWEGELVLQTRRTAFQLDQCRQAENVDRTPRGH